MATIDSLLPDDVPIELVEAVAQEAAVDADRVVLFLRRLGITSSEEKPVHLPGWLLLGLGAALRLLVWERNGTRSLLNANLPPAREAIRDLFSTATDRPAQLEPLAQELTMRIFRVRIDQMAWHGRSLWDADLVLGEAEEDLLVDALAGFLWQNRHALDNPEGDQR
jgi:hypothetical protein